MIRIISDIITALGFGQNKMSNGSLILKQEKEV
jgi:hypothetical protein